MTTNKNFLPEGYEAPKAQSGYMSLEQGNNKFLILDSAIIGYEYWNTENKPVRMKEEPKDKPKDLRKNDKGEDSKIKHFWAFPVWNFEDGRVQVLEITQSTIQREITNLVNNDDWGTPIMTYAITIHREGEKLTTNYTVTPSPAKEIPEEIVKTWEEVKGRGFDLSRLYAGGNPFSDESKEDKAKEEEYKKM